jgi:hypothetical protein
MVLGGEVHVSEEAERGTEKTRLIPNFSGYARLNPMEKYRKVEPERGLFLMY